MGESWKGELMLIKQAAEIDQLKATVQRLAAIVADLVYMAQDRPTRPDIAAALSQHETALDGILGGSGDEP